MHCILVIDQKSAQPRMRADYINVLVFVLLCSMVHGSDFFRFGSIGMEKVDAGPEDGGCSITFASK